VEFNVNHISPVFFGPNTSLQTGARLKAMGVTHALFVFDQGVKKAGIPDKIIAGVKEAGVQVSVFDGVQADPPDFTVDQGAEIGRKANVDGVVGVGGGSTMDTAKAINLLLGNPGSISQYLTFPPPPLKPGKTLVLIPTTSGTGSEVTHFAVITDSKTHAKRSPVGPLVRAKLAIIDPTLTVGMPPSVTADTGMDAFAHCAEAMTAVQRNPMSDLLAEKGISIVMEFLPKAVKDGKDLDARTQMSFAAMLGGYAFNDSNTQLGHAIGHTLGSMYHIPHGNACGVVLPEILECEAEAVPDAVARIAAAMGLKVKKGATAGSVGAQVREALAAFMLSIGQKTFKQLNVPAADLAKVAESAGGPGLAKSSARPVTVDDVKTMLQKAYER
jgi:alcohol dehydrogenase